MTNSIASVVMADEQSIETAKTRVRELAASLHSINPMDFKCKLSEEDLSLLKFLNSEIGVKIEDDHLHFESIGVLDQMIAEYYFHIYEKDLDFSDVLWLKHAQEIHQKETGFSHKVSGKFLALLHHKYDIFKLAIKLLDEKSINVYDFIQILTEAIEHIDQIEFGCFFSFYETYNEKYKNSYLEIFFLPKLEKHYSKDQENCIKTTNNLRARINGFTVNIYPGLIISLAKFDIKSAIEEVYKDTYSENEILKSVALMTIGKLVSAIKIPEENIESLLHKIKLELNSENDLVKNNSIYAMIEFLAITDLIDEEIDRLSEFSENNFLYMLSHFLFVNHKKIIDKKNFKKWIKILCKIPLEEKNSIYRFDWILSFLIKNIDYEIFVEECINTWLIFVKNKTDEKFSVIKEFNNTFLEAKKSNSILNRIITNWFLSDDFCFLHAIEDLLMNLSVEKIYNINFDLNILNALDNNEIIFLVRRMLGYTINEKHLLSLTISLLKVDGFKNKTLKLTQELLILIGKDFHGLVEKNNQELLKAIGKRNLELVIKEIDIYFDALKSLSYISELTPSKKIERTFFKERSKANRDMMKDIQEESIFVNLVAKIPVKAGTSFFSFHTDQYNEPTSMHTHSAGYSLPRRFVTDTVGYEIERLNYRMAKKDTL